jgi:hypothetical protein
MIACLQDVPVQVVRTIGGLREAFRAWDHPTREESPQTRRLNCER